jgi:RimJ/RimL family protein N-acetyltransferase
VTSDIPVLETPRLILRGRTMEDFPAYLGLWADPPAWRHLAEKPLTEEEVWQKFARIAGIWALKGYGFWLLEEKATG